MEWHPASELFPMLNPEQFNGLAIDIQEKGLLVPIELHSGKVLDGRNRLNACEKTGVEPRFVDMTGEVSDPIAYVISRNLHRRHLNEAQRAMVAARAKSAYEEEAKERQRERKGNQSGASQENLPDLGQARDKAGEAVGVSGRSVSHAENVQQHGTPALVDACDSGDAAISSAATVATSYPPEQQNEIVAEGEKQGDVKGAVSAAAKKAHVANNSGNNEWYTPAPYLDAAKAVMGNIELDPATSKVAQENVGAEKFYTIHDDGLAKQWKAKTLWMNPPYAQPAISQFCDKLCSHVDSGDVKQAVVLVNNATETKWFQGMAQRAASICFPSGRVRFIDENGNPSGAPLQGQAVLYFGDRGKAFRDAFTEIGFVVREG